MSNNRTKTGITQAMPRMIEGVAGLVDRGKLEAQFATTQDPMVPRFHYVINGIENAIYLNSILEPAESIPQGDDTDVIDLAACEHEGWKGVPVPSDISRITELRCLNPAPTGNSVTILVAGDSLTPGHALLFDEQAVVGLSWSVTYIGSDESNPPVKHEGTGGQTWQKHVTDSGSAFVNGGQLDIPNYLQTYGTPEFVALVGGSNDASNEDSEAPGWIATRDTALDYLEQLVDGFLAADPNLKIAIFNPPTPNPNAGAYTGTSTDFATWRKTHRSYVEEVIRRFDGKDPRVFVPGSHLVCDRDSVGVWGSDGPFDAIHPESDGYRQIAQGALMPWVMWHKLNP